jgi:hypothetical protein
MIDALGVPALIEAADPDVLDDPIDERLLDEEDTSEEELRYDVEGLVRRLQRGDVKIPVFQRGFVWPIKQASRFIESLLLGLPVPGIFLSTEPITQKLLVIDGQQRLTTLRAFYDGIFPSNKKEFSLVEVQSSLVGKTYKSLADDDRRTLDNAIIHATVIKQANPEDGGSSVYKIFERLNSGGMLLSPQEIRTAIYNGPIVGLLSSLNSLPEWRSLFGPTNKRMRDQELVLRFLALYGREGKYKRPMKSFLNAFMDANRDLSGPEQNQSVAAFELTAKVVGKILGAKAFKPSGSFNAALFDAVMVAVAERLNSGPITDEAAFRTAFETLLEDKEFLQWISRSTADDEVVKGRIARARLSFSGVA